MCQIPMTSPVLWSWWSRRIIKGFDIRRGGSSKALVQFRLSSRRLNGYSPVMSYKVVIDKDGISYPQFYCDVCREPIETLEEGNTIFSSEIPGNTSHVHKLCSMKTKPHGYDNWHDLSNDVVWLLKRYGWLTKEGGVTPKFEKAVDKATKFEGF
jgi:hypothetical protein